MTGYYCLDIEITEFTNTRLPLMNREFNTTTRYLTYLYFTDIECIAGEKP